jgi:hypothetical protein
LSPVEVRTTGISPADALAGITAKPSPPPHKTGVTEIDENLRAKVTDSPLLERGISWLNAGLSQFGLGDTIKALYRR